VRSQVDFGNLILDPNFQFASFLLDASSDSAELLEQLLSKEVDDASTRQVQSIEELMKALEQKDKLLEDKDKIIEGQQKGNQALRKEKGDQRKQLEDKEKENQALRKDIEDLKQALLLATKM